MSTTTPQTPGNFEMIFGTSKATKTIGLIIQSHNSSSSGTDVTVQNEVGETIWKKKYDIQSSGTITGKPILDASSATTYETVRAALAVGASFTVPTNKGITKEAGLAIIDSIDENTTNNDVAEMTINYTRHPLINQMVDDTPAAEDEV